MYESVIATVTVAIGRAEHVLNRDRYQDGLPGRELAHALTKLQEAKHWLQAAEALAPPEPER